MKEDTAGRPIALTIHEGNGWKIEPLVGWVVAKVTTDWFEKEQLHFAANEGDIDKVKELIRDGYDVNAFDEDLSLTPLHYAAKGEHLEIVEYLLSVGADVNAHEEVKICETPLGEIAANCSYEMAELLINAGANPAIPGWMQITALDRARNRTKAEGKRVYELLAGAAKYTFES